MMKRMRPALEQVGTLNWKLHRDNGLSAAGKKLEYWMNETAHLRVQEGRDKPVSLFTRSADQVNFRYHDCYDRMSDAVKAAEALDAA